MIIRLVSFSAKMPDEISLSAKNSSCASHYIKKENLFFFIVTSYTIVIDYNIVLVFVTVKKKKK